MGNAGTPIGRSNLLEGHRLVVVGQLNMAITSASILRWMFTLHTRCELVTRGKIGGRFYLRLAPYSSNPRVNGAGLSVARISCDVLLLGGVPACQRHIPENAFDGRLRQGDDQSMNTTRENEPDGNPDVSESLTETVKPQTYRLRNNRMPATVEGMMVPHGKHCPGAGGESAEPTDEQLGRELSAPELYQYTGHDLDGSVRAFDDQGNVIGFVRVDEAERISDIMRERMKSPPQGRIIHTSSPEDPETTKWLEQRKRPNVLLDWTMDDMLADDAEVEFDSGEALEQAKESLDRMRARQKEAARRIVLEGNRLTGVPVMPAGHKAIEPKSLMRQGELSAKDV